MESSQPGRATQLLNRLGSGDSSVSEELLELIYAELHELARVHMARESRAHTLQPTALVSEVYLRLVRQEDASWDSRRQFYSMASKVMRSILVDHARAKATKKRGGDRVRISLEERTSPGPGPTRDEVDILDLHVALERLSQVDAELSRVVELRFFGGLSVRETAETMGVPMRTVERRLKVANVWLREALRELDRG